MKKWENAELQEINVDLTAIEVSFGDSDAVSGFGVDSPNFPNIDIAPNGDNPN